MTPRPIAPIRRQITRFGLWWTAAMLAGFALVLCVHELVIGHRILLDNLGAQARIVGANSTAALMFDNADDAGEILSSMRESPDMLQAAILRADGRMLARWEASGSPAPCHPAGSAALREPGVSTRWCGIAMVVPIQLHDQALGHLVLEAGLNTIWRNLARTLLASALVALLAFAASVPLWRRLSQRVTMPLNDLVALTQRVREQHDYTQRAQAQGSAEVRELATSFNELMGELQQRSEQVQHELSQRRMAEVRLNELAYADNVTLLPNRHYFLERLDQLVGDALARGQAFALLYLDLDGFKAVNDTLGHHRGDELLRHVAERLRQALRSADVVCRLGGDEFAVILPGVLDHGSAAAVADALMQAIAQPYLLDGHRATVSTSIGGCLCPADGTDRHALMRRADVAMYVAKAEGKHRYRPFSGEMDDQLARRQAIEQALPGATAQGGLELVFQPIVTLEGARLLAFEALLRWQHPQLGPVSPAEFVPLAEHSGDIGPIGEWALREACARLREWRQLRPALTMSVNLSARQLADDAAVERLCRVYAEAGLPLGAVDLEITEGHAVVQSPEMASRLSRIRQAGFGLAIDDFGVGYSSLSYLARLPVTRLKIDRSFVRDMHEGTQQGAIIRSVVAIGRALQLSVVAEGIETAEQVALLREMGCTLGQGWYYGRAVPQAQAAALLLKADLAPHSAGPEAVRAASPVLG